MAVLSSFDSGVNLNTHPTDVRPPSYQYEPHIVSTTEWVQKKLRKDCLGTIKSYLISLFPIFSWIYRYNLTWATGDIIAGLTVGTLLVPQSMAYAKIATLPVQYGLYSSFVGVFIYCFFATSKDVTIGPVAVMSLQTAHVIAAVQASHPNTWSAPLIATTLAFFCGIITLGIGVLRLGFVVEFIPVPAIAGFMTGSAITILSSQVAFLLGTSNLFKITDSCYIVIINILKHLPQTKLDAAFGLPCLVFLYIYRFGFKWASIRYPRYKRYFIYALVLRNAIVMVFITIISYLVCRSNPNSPPIAILKTVPRGFQNVGVLKIDRALAAALGPQLPVSTVILLLEHIAISKSFGRVNEYKIIPDQELIAIGTTNTLGTFFNAYPATGSFSRSAIKSMSGVRTPLAGIVTGLIVILALYALTDAFFWIPNAGIGAIIIHAVGDLIVPPKQAYRFWKIAPLECIIFIASVIVTIFGIPADGIYTSVGASIVVLLYRIARPRGNFLGRVRIHSAEEISTSPNETRSRSVYVPLHRKNMNPDIHVEDPPPGILIFRFEESFTFPNASTINDRIVDYAKTKTRKGRATRYKKLGDRPWNEGFVPRNTEKFHGMSENDNRPLLRAVVYDFGAVTNIDSTGVQSLVDTRQQLNRYADREVEYHFAQILSPWIKRALVAGGFGSGTPSHRVVEVASVVPISSVEDPYIATEASEKTESENRGVGETVGPEDSEMAQTDISTRIQTRQVGPSQERNVMPIVATNYPFFHLDLDDAVRSAERAQI